jgi:uncharacterized lipoprotein YehR (DUF1307 family)
MGEFMKTTFKTKIVFALLCVISLAACNSKSGATGPAGPQGPSGDGGKIVATMNCSGYITGLGGAAGTALNGLRVDYDAVLTGSGDVYATASVADDLAQVSGTAFYAAGQAGANSGAVEIIADYHNSLDGATWDISLNRTTLVTTVVYDDDSLAAPVSLNFTSAACSQSYF